jgi:heat shock protein HslJ
MKRILLPLVSVAVLAAVFSCKSGQTAVLTDTRWRPTALYGEPVAPETEAFIVFSADDRRVSGNGGCNTFGGTYRLAPDGGISFSQMIFTRKMCFGANIEERLSAAFGAAVRYAVRDRALLLFDSDGTEIATLAKTN